MNGATPRYLTNYLNTNDNPIYNTRALDQNNVRRFRARINISNNHFSIVVSINGTN